VLASAGVISIVTAITRVGYVSVRTVAASPQTVGDGRIWLLASSALVADRPAVASVVGFVIVGLAAVALCGPRVAWLAAASGHVFSAAIVYAGIGIARAADPTAFQSLVDYPDYGTSAIIAAWIGALACLLWLRERRVQAVALCVTSAVLGWYFKGTLTALDTEHAFALGFGVATMYSASRIGGRLQTAQ
jgi:hypothetical protein